MPLSKKKKAKELTKSVLLKAGKKASSKAIKEAKEIGFSLVVAKEGGIYIISPNGKEVLIKKLKKKKAKHLANRRKLAQ